jgi:deoxyribonuclease V
MKELHRWDLSPRDAERIQVELAKSIVSKLPDGFEPRVVAGVDVHMTSEGKMRAVVVSMRFPELIEIESVSADVDPSFPYIPGLLAFREGPAVLKAFERIGTKPDLILFDAQGIAHPRRLGLASHMGLWLEIPSIGCAKSLLYGTHGAVGEEVGERSEILDPRDGSVIGFVLRTRKGVHPVYVSIGHLIDLESAADMVLRCCKKYRIPEPIRLAHSRAQRGDTEEEIQGRLF